MTKVTPPHVNWEFVRQVGYGKFLVRTARRQLSRRLLHRNDRVRLPSGLVMEIPQSGANASEIWVTNCDIDWGSERLLIRHLEPDKSFFDVGAHIGYYSLLVAPCVRDVYAFEPDIRNFAALERNAARAGNVTVVRRAVADAVGAMPFVIAADAATSRLATRADDGASTTTVEVTTLDQFAADHPALRVTGVKIDVEGFDGSVLAGARRVIARDRPLILTEFNLGEGTNDGSAMFSFVESLNYRVFAFVRALGGRRLKPDRLLHLDRATLRDTWYKMLFLAPERLHAQFAALADPVPPRLL